MSYTQLRAFHAVAENLGFTSAARHLNVSQSTITMQVRELEARHKVELFHRKGRVVKLTQSGESLFEITRRLVHAHRESLEFLDGLKTLSAGKLRLAAVGPFHATDMASKFKAAYPKVEITMQFGNSQDTLNALLDYSADVAVLAQVDAHQDVKMEHYSQHKVVIFVHKNHRFFDRQSIRISELEGEDFVLREPGSTTRRAFTAAIRKSGVKINSHMEIGSREGVWKAVSLGLGIGVVADFEFVATPDLRAVAITDADITTKYYVAYLQSRINTQLVRAFRTTAMSGNG